MGEKDLVQELRELADTHTIMKAPCAGLLELTYGKDCLSMTRDCRSCSKLVIDALADRIEAEYDPKPEPDSVEKVALGLLGTLDAIYAQDMIPASMRDIIGVYTKRLEVLGVTFDD